MQTRVEKVGMVVRGELGEALRPVEKGSVVCGVRIQAWCRTLMGRARSAR